MKSLIISVIISTSIFAQTNPLKTARNIRLFADYLCCEQDYLRAAEEYKKLLNTFTSDTILYKTAKCYSIIGDYDEAEKFFSRIDSSSIFLNNAIRELGKIYYLSKDELSLNKISGKNEFAMSDLIKLKIALMLGSNKINYNLTELLPENDSDFEVFNKLMYERQNPDYKSELIAGILSAIIPGSGKIYTEEYGDGITSFILTGLFSYLAYDYFRHQHKFRGYLFSTITAGFYLGNVYGSVASAQIFNAKVEFSFLEKLSDFLIKRNYFVKEYEFCK